MPKTEGSWTGDETFKPSEHVGPDPLVVKRLDQAHPARPTKEWKKELFEIIDPMMPVDAAYYDYGAGPPCVVAEQKALGELWHRDPDVSEHFGDTLDRVYHSPGHGPDDPPTPKVSAPVEKKSLSPEQEIKRLRDLLMSHGIDPD